MVFNFPSSSNTSSTISFQDITHKRIPVKKVKLRSLQPTLSRLLLGVVEPEITEHGTKQIHKMEEAVSNGKRMFPDEFSTGSSIFGESKRTEDIFIREDEDGIRSHYCPLDAKRDGIINENNTSPNSDPDNESDNQSVISWDETMPFVSAGKRLSSESDNEDSSDDSLKYTPLENQPTPEENSPVSSPNRILQLHQLSERTACLDKRTMEAWLEESSDDYDTPFAKDPELPLTSTVGNESDMEEFEKDSETEIENGSLNTNDDIVENDEKDEGSKDSLTEAKSSINDIKDRSNKKSSSKFPEDEYFEGEQSDKNGSSSNLNNPIENESNEEKLEKHSEIESSVQDFQNKQRFDYTSDVDMKSGHNKHDVMEYFHVKNQTQKNKSDDNEIKEPIETNSGSRKKSETHADYGDNLCDETSATKSESTDEEILKLKKLMRDESTPGEIPSSVTRSDVFEPVLIQEQRVLTKPRNKLTKFFQSFKKKLERNKKA